ncbi:MAG: NAD(P)-dependent oxidoreductase [Verrucomicrobiota bacterium]
MIYEKVGVIGLGIIGSRVAQVLRQAGKHVYVWSRSPRTEPNFLSSPGEVAQMAELIQIFVTDGAALLSVIDQLRDQLTRNHVIVNCSTVDPESSVKAYNICKEHGAGFLDSPFTGSKDASANAALVYYVGGDALVLDKVSDTLRLSSKSILHVGKVGEASLLKVVTNMISATTVEVLSEAYGLVNAAGMDPAVLEEALELNACSSGLTGMKLPTILRRDYEPHFSLNNMFKDAKIGLGLGKDLGVDLPALSATATLMFRSIQKGNGELDYSVLAARFQQNDQTNSEEDPFDE